MWQNAVSLDELIKQVLQLKLDLEDAHTRIQRLEAAMFTDDELDSFKWTDKLRREDALRKRLNAYNQQD